MAIKDFFKKIFSKILILNCLGMIILTLLIGVGASYFLNFYTRHGEVLNMPDLRGKKYAVASAELDRMGLTATIRDTGYVKKLPANIVLEQSIAPGSKIKEGRIIEITINAGMARPIALPDLADNSSLREAEAKLNVLGFHKISIKYVTGEKDWVYGIEVNGKAKSAGQRITVDTPISIVVGDGKMDGEDSDDEDIAPLTENQNELKSAAGDSVLN